jgi:tripartite-type tricarboxylate transporter receptor subunit TctC
MEAIPNLAHIRAKEMKPLAIFSTKRDPRLPDVPTFVEEGYPDVITYTYFVLYTQAKTPAPIVKKLEDALKQTIQDKEAQEKLEKVDVTPAFLSSEETKAFMASETKKWSDVIKKTKLDFTE